MMVRFNLNLQLTGLFCKNASFSVYSDDPIHNRTGALQDQYKGKEEHVKRQASQQSQSSGDAQDTRRDGTCQKGTKISGPVHRWRSVSKTSCDPRSEARSGLDGARRPGNKLGNASLTERAGLPSLTLANQTGRVKNPCVRHASSIGEHEPKDVPDPRRSYRVVA
jgi:hypothetical protein